MTTTGIKRYVVRPAKRVDSPKDNGKFIANLNSELQAKLSERKDPVGEPASSPLKMKRIGGGGRRKSAPEKTTAAVRVNPSSGKTKWHVQEDQLKQPSPSQVRSVSYLKSTIPPPPKNPPPVLALKTQTPDSSKASLQKSLSAVPPKHSHKQEIQIHPPSSPPSISSPPSSSSPLSSPSSADPTTRRDSVKVPLCGSTSVGGVRELMMVFESDQTKRATEKQRAKDSLFIKTNSEPKDIGRKVLTEADSPTRNTSSLATIKQSKREEKMEALDGKCIIINPEVHSATSSKESLGGVFSSSDYINVFEDEDFARFDKRSQAQKLQQNNSMGRRDKKPKPLPRKGSCGTFPVCRNSSNNSSLSSLNSLHFSSGFDMSLSEKPELDKPDISKGMERVDVDISERMERVNAGTSEEIEGVNEDSSEGTEGVKGDTSKGIEGVNVELSMEMEGVNSKETSGVTVDVSNGTERVNITENSSDVTMSSKPLDALETEIDLLANIGKLPPLTDTEAAQAEPTLSVHKQELSKTKSHIPTTGGIPITRRTTPKERKELRHGVCSDGAQIESDEDDYIPMNPICLMSRTFGEPHQLLVPPTDPRASGYYLKVLPNDVISVAPSASQDRPKSPGDVYIDMDTAKDLKSLPVPEATKSTARPSPMTTDRENTPIGGSLHAQQTSRNQIQPGKFRGLKYSDVTIEQPGRASIKDQAASPPINYQLVQHGKQLPSNAKESSGTTEPKKLMFADRPLPPRPDHDCPYYITNSVPMGTVPPPPVLQSMLNRRTVWHEYVEIDEEELEKLSSPPDVPKRPMNLDKLAERKNIPSVEYSYAAVPGKNMFGLYWINFQARNPTASITPPSEVVSKRSTPPPRTVDRNDTLPPPPPPKSESLLREQGLIPTPQPYLTPLFKKRKMSVPIIPLTNSTPLPSLISHPKDRAQLMRRESSDEDGVRMKGKSVPTKSNQGQSRRRTPPPRPSPPRLKSTSGPAVVTVGENRDKALRGERSKAVPSGLRPLFHQQRSLDEEGREGEVKGHKKLARQRSCSTGDLSAASGRNRLRESKSSVPDSGGRKSPTIGVTMATDTVETKQVARQPPQVTTQTQEAPIRRQNLRVRNKIDRQSLAIIMQNREAIVRQLSIAKADGRQVNVNTDGSGSGSDKQLLLRSLGEILLEIDALLRHNLCTEEDLVSAIEQQLSIKLQPCKESTSPNSSVSIESPTAQSKQQSLYNQSGESMSPGQPNKLPWQHSMVITDQDVDEVLSFVKTNGIMSPEKEKSPEFPPPEQHIKPRSGTVIILDDPPSPHKRTHMENNLHSPDSPDSDHDSKTCDCGLVAAKESELARSFDHTLHNRVDLWSFPSKGMRDQRSFSAGQKPLRRVNAKRRPSASDLETASCNTAFCNGAGTFTHKGGRLTNVISGVEIEIPEGAIPKGRKQRLWFDVVQAVYDPREEEDEMQRSLSSSASGETKPENHERKDRKVELSPMILVGPCDAALLRPIKIKLPHCLPYRNNSWHLQMVARVQNSTSEDWIELSNSSGLIIPERNKKRKFFKNSTYQMSLEFATVRTKHLGCFRLCGNPIRHGTHSAKKMVASVYTKRDRSRDDGIVSLDIFLTNAITDQIQVRPLHSL